MRGFTANADHRSAAIVGRDRLRRRPALLGQPVQGAAADDDHPLRRSAAGPSWSSPASSSTTLAATFPLVAASSAGSPRPSGCSSSPARPRRRSGCSPTCPSASRPTAARSWACTRSSSRSARSSAASSAASPRTGAASTACSSPRCVLLGIALVPLARLRTQEHQLEPGLGPRASRATAGVTERPRPWTPVAARPRPPRRRRRAAPPRDRPPGWRSCGPAGRAVDAAIATNAVLGVVMPGGCGIGGDAFWLIWDAAAGRQVALNGSGRAPAARRRRRSCGRGPDATIPLRGPLVDHGPGRGPLVGRRPRAVRPAVARRDPGAGHRARTGRASRPGTASSTRSSRTRPRWPRRSAPAPASSRSTGRTAARGGPASGSGCRPSRRRCERSPTTASTPSTRASSRERQARRRWPRSGCRSRSATCAATPRRGASRSRSTTAASG